MGISSVENKQSPTPLTDQIKNIGFDVVVGIGTAIIMKESQAPLVKMLTSLGLKPVQVGVGKVGFSINTLLDLVQDNLSQLPLPQWLKTKITKSTEEAKSSQSFQILKQSTLYLLTTFLFVYTYSYFFNDEEDHNMNTLFADTLYQAVLYLPYTLLTNALKAREDRNIYNSSITALLSYI
ncbi:MAG: hypothetical protein K940chlam8_00444 [Chlamydiae bacterium]|nr:hypothetical protein [Chlamydiota bacterium]